MTTELAVLESLAKAIQGTSEALELEGFSPIFCWKSDRFRVNAIMVGPPRGSIRCPRTLVTDVVALTILVLTNFQIRFWRAKI